MNKKMKFQTALMSALFLLFGAVTAGPSLAEAAEAGVNLHLQSTEPLNINQADSETLQSIRGIGPALAQRIIAYREDVSRFESVDDLQSVKGVGSAKLNKIRRHVTV